MGLYYSDELTQIYHGDCRDYLDILASADVGVIDPPFDQWNETPIFLNKTRICFTNWQNRSEVESRYGTPRAEIIWHFRDGRWVSHAMPLITHESILVYGPTGECYVGDEPENMEPQRKGNGAIGRHKMAERVYHPRTRLALKSVIELPRNVSGDMGCWGKPVALMSRLLEWAGRRVIADPYMGSGTTCVAARALGFKVIAVELDEYHCEMATKRLSQGVLHFEEIKA